MPLLTTLALLACPQAVTGAQSLGPQLRQGPLAPPRPWLATFGASGNDWLADLAPTANGGMFAAGQTFSFGGGDSDAWVARIDARGRARWEVLLGGAGADEVRSVAATRDGGCVLAGSTTSSGAGSTDGWVVKLAADGSIQWQRTFGTAGQESFESIVTVPGAGSPASYYVAGVAELGAFGRDAWVLALDGSGAPVWQKAYGGKQDDYASALTATADGLVLVVASQSALGGAPVAFTRPWLLRLDTEGLPVVQRTFDFSSGDLLYDVFELEDGTFVTTGEILAFAFFRGDVWVQRLDASLNVLWDQRFGDSFLNFVDTGRRVRPTEDGGLLVAASTGTAGAGSEDLWLLHLDGAGQLLADRTFGGPGFDNGLALAADPAGLAFLGGIRQPNPAAGDFDVFLARVTPDVLAGGADCPPTLETQPNVWTSPLTIGTPTVDPVDTGVVPQAGAATATVLETGAFVCQQ